MDLEKLKLPDPHGFATEDFLKTACKFLGIALVVQWFVPWLSVMSVQFSWDLMSGGGGFAMLWPLLGGSGLIALGFLPDGMLKPGILLSVAAGVALLGLLSFSAFGNPIVSLATPMMMSFLGVFGLLALLFGLMLWMRQGFSAVAWGILLGGLVAIGLWLLVPVRGDMPLIAMFKVLGADGVNFFWRLLFMLLNVAFVGFAVLVGFKVVLPRDAADERWLLPLFWLGLALPVVSLLLQGFAGVFDSGWILLIALHILVIVVSYLGLAVLAGFALLGALLDGSFKELF